MRQRPTMAGELRVPAWTIVVPFESRAQIICRRAISATGSSVPPDFPCWGRERRIHAGHREDVSVDGGAIAVEPFTLRRKWVRAPSFADN